MSSALETIVVERDDDAVWIKLDRPKARNAINAQMIEEIASVLAEVGGEERLRCVVIWGEGKAFCAGADLKDAKTRTAERDGARAVSCFLRSFRDLTTGIESFPKPVVAGVGGMALAAGLELILCCDLVIATKSARFGDAHANFGLVPAGGSSVRLPRKIGPNRAKFMIYTGEFVTAANMMDWGLVNQMTEDGDLKSSISELISTLSKKSPLGLGRMKALVNSGADMPVAAAIEAELAVADLHYYSADRAEGLAAFAEKREPHFVGR